MEGNYPLVSIVMPTYNAATFLSIAIDSVMKQTMQDWELIIIDDASTDFSSKVMEKAAKNDARIRIFHNHSNLGAAQSRNIAFKMVRGQFVALLDSDDLWEPMKLERQLALARETGAGIIYCSYSMIDEAGNKRWPDFIVPERTSFKQMLSSSVISCSTALLSADICQKYCFPTTTYHEDLAFWLLLLKEGYEARGLTEVLASYRVRSNSRSFNKIHSAAQRWSVYRDYLGLPAGESLLALEKYTLAGLKKYKKLS